LQLGGIILNSHFEIELSDQEEADVLIILSSRGGAGEKARNPDYAKQLARILKEIQKSGSIITKVDLLSTVAIANLADLALDLPYPIRLEPETPIEDVRKMIQNAQLLKGQKHGASGGNSTKRIGIHVKTGPNVAVAGMKAILTDPS